MTRGCNYEHYMYWREQKNQKRVTDFQVRKSVSNAAFLTASLSDYFKSERKPRKEITAQEEMVIDLLRWRDGWSNIDRALVILEKAKINSYIQSLGVKAKWLIDYGVFLCSLCRKDGVDEKLQKVKYIGCVCWKCKVKWKMEIQEMMTYASQVQNRLKK